MVVQKKRHALQKAEEERRITERGEGAADVGHKENEEDDRVHPVFAVLVGAQKRADEQHGRTGRPHPAGEDGTERQKPGVHDGRTHELTFEADAARDGEQREQQDDEGNVFHEKDMDELIGRQRETVDHGAGDEKGQSPEQGHFPEVVMPEVGDGQRPDGDGQQHAHKGNGPDNGQFRSIEVMVSSRCVGGQRHERRQGQRGKGGEQSFHLRSAPWVNFYNPISP